jgi:hypothetical protein
MGSKVPPAPRYRRLTLHERRKLKMASSAHAYVRGSTVQFYKWLQNRGERAVPKGPPCGSAVIVTRGTWARSQTRRVLSTFKYGIWTKL